MGLPLRNPSSFSSSLTSGSAPRGGLSITPDSDTDSDPSEPPCYRSLHNNRHRHSRNPHRACRAATGCRLGPDGKPHCTSSGARPVQHRKRHRLRAAARLRQSHATLPAAAAAETHHVKPRSPWAADADEGCSLARSSIELPGDHHQYHTHPDGEEQHGRRRRSRSGSAAGESRSRPPSLERQDAFRDERTVKKPRTGSGERSAGVTSHSLSWSGVGDERRSEAGEEEKEAEEIARLYRMGLLYDDEHERGEGFSLDRIVRDEPVYSLRVRPARRRRRDRREARDDRCVSLSVDLAFSALAEDEALAGWLLSGSSHSTARDEARPWSEAVHDTPRLTVIYELADDVSMVSANDFLGSEVSYCEGKDEDDDELTWAMLDGCNGNEDAVPAMMAEEAAVEEMDPWVVLDHDGS